MPSRLTYLNVGVQQAQLGDLAVQGNITLNSGKSLKMGGTTIIDIDGLIPYSTLKGSPSAVTWGSLTGVPTTLLQSNANIDLDATKTISVGGTTIVDSAAKVDWSLLKNTPYLFAPPTVGTLPTAADQQMGDFTYAWVTDVAQIQGMTGADTVNKDEGYILLNTRGPGDTALQTRLKVDQTITTYGTIVPNATNTLALGQSGNRWSTIYGTNGNFTGNVDIQNVATGAGGATVQNTLGSLTLNAGVNALAFQVAGTLQYYANATCLTANLDNVRTLGQQNTRWSNVYATNVDTATLTTSGAAVIGGITTINSKKMVLYDQYVDANQFYGFGVTNPGIGTLNAQIHSTAAQFAWSAGTGATTSSTVMTLSGTGNLQVAGQIGAYQGNFGVTQVGGQTNQYMFNIQGTGRWFCYANGFGPNIDNTATAGGSGNRYSVMYAVTGTINTSDRREKTAIVPSSLGLDFVERLTPVSYKWKVGHNEVADDGTVAPRAGSRTFYGLIAQDVKAVLDDLAVGDFAGWTLGDKEDADSVQGLRYTEFVAPLIRAVQEVSVQLKDISARLAALEQQ